MARWRVTLGFIFAAIVVWLATPTVTSLQFGAGVAIVGELIRLWAAGHLEKSKEVTQSGPYRYTRHPLYLGSSLIGIGIAIAANNAMVAALVLTYLALTLTAAMRSEEAHLREKFGDAYDAYAQRRAPRVERTFSVRRALHNREHHTVAGLLAGLLLLSMKL
ncbi:MAG TPA: isoprenylcysteine carboxylmethyltransferase family protein [Vicinamibacterales bacterium]|nr:isoprenylcysteine carboxylmethyltransferase family protein [Vicinamibacterales bacterium]